MWHSEISKVQQSQTFYSKIVFSNWSRKKDKCLSLFKVKFLHIFKTVWNLVLQNSFCKIKKKHFSFNCFFMILTCPFRNTVVHSWLGGYQACVWELSAVAWQGEVPLFTPTPCWGYERRHPRVTGGQRWCHWLIFSTQNYLKMVHLAGMDRDLPSESKVWLKVLWWELISEPWIKERRVR